MECKEAGDWLGALTDGACPLEVRSALDDHLLDCPRCRNELSVLRAATAALADPPDADVPSALWPAIERRLDAPPWSALGAWLGRRRPWAIAAGVVLAFGISTVVYERVGGRSSRAAAAPINFSVLLDALPLDAEKAFRKFLILYDARSITPSDARRHAPELSFDIPDDLPGGFRLAGVFALRFGDAPGLAARYERGDEFLAAIFHKPVQCMNQDADRALPCVVGEHRGRRVSVGDWSMVHVTDSTTCHCVLSRLDESVELPPILDAVAPTPDAAESSRQQEQG